MWNRANFALCIKTDEFVDLEPRRLYRIRADKKALELGLLRVVDESGEDYLYSATLFLPVRLTPAVARAVRQLDREDGNGR